MENKKPYYITTAIAYTSGKPHIGNVYEIVLADAIARFKRAEGYDVRFQTGTDEHGQKVEEKAKAAGKTPKQFVDDVAAVIKQQFDVMNTSYDYFIRTTDESHERQVQKIFKKFYDQGDIYKGYYEGLYCQEDEAFYTKSQLTEEGKCPVCGGEVVPMKEEAYFFKMSKYADQLMKYIDEHPHFIQPESRKNEMVNNFLKPGLQDLCVSRTSFKWGIPVEFDPKHVVYVWIDALSNYITGLGYDADGNHDELYKKYWPADLHLIGKDIIRFHTIYWPIMLMALGEPLPKQVFGHPWLLIGDSKMSKSHGNVIYADDLVKLFGVDAVRFIMLHEMPFAQDGHVTYDLMIERINSDLANNLGNLVNRTISMQNKYFGGVVANPNVSEPIDDELKAMATGTVKKVIEKMDELRVADAIQDILDLFSRCNKYIDETMPWALAKSEDVADQKRLQSVMYHLAEALRIIAILVSPILTKGAPKIWEQLGLTGFDQVTLTDAKTWGQISDGSKVVKGDPIYPRFDMPEMVEVTEPNVAPALTKDEASREAAGEGTSEAFEPLKEEISFDDFEKLDMRVAKVLTCEKVPKSKKLLLFTLDIGLETRTVVSGISQFYAPEDLIGKKVIYLANLKPRKIMGIESAGMILSAADIDHNLEVTNVADSKPGATIG